MKHIYFFLIISCLGVTDIAGQTTFQKYYKGTLESWSNSIIQTSDSGYLIVGNTYTFTSNSEIFVIKTTVTGDTIWTRILGDSNGDHGYSSCQIFDGTYIICGDERLIRLDLNGNIIWSKKYSTTFPLNNLYIEQTYDSSIVAFGTIQNIWPTDLDMVITKFDLNGAIIWVKSYGLNGTDDGYTGQQTNEGGLIMTGYSNWPFANVCLLRTDMNGDTLWIKGYGGGLSFLYPSSVKQTFDGGFILTCIRGDSMLDYSKSSLIKTDSAGNFVWSKLYDSGFEEHYPYVQETSDSGFILAVGSNYGNGNGTRTILRKLDPFGNLLWSKVYHDSISGTEFSSVLQTYDGGFVFSAGLIDTTGYILLIKTDSAGSTSCGENNLLTNVTSVNISVINLPFIILNPSTNLINAPITVDYSSGMSDPCLLNNLDQEETQTEILVYPNPVSNELRITIKDPIHSIQIFNLLGESILNTTEINSSMTSIDCKHIPPGIYIIEIRTKDRILATKFIKQ